MSDNHPYLNFDEYIQQGEPSQKEKALNWETAIGLQAVDGLRVSDYLRETAQKHIEGEMSSDDVKRRIREYYQTKTKREPDDYECQEADSVSSNIQEILATNTLGEQWDLRNRYLHIHPTEEWSVQPNLAAPTSTPTSREQAPIKYPSS